MDEAVAGYQLEALIGRGATSSVWRARPPSPVGAPVALKRLDVAPDGPVASLAREAAILQALDHPHIVAVRDVIADPPGVALVMPLARGGSLRHLLDEWGLLGPGQTVAVLAPLADALGSAHRHGVVHGDVKPANILFTIDGEPLLADFGVARRLGSRLAADQVRRGTPGYVDPALLRSTAEPGPAADVYSLAVVAYEALAGRPPHRGSVAEVLAAAEQGRHRPLRSLGTVPDHLAAVIDGALSPDPGDRPTSATELAVALRASVPPTSISLPGPATRPGAEVDHDGGTRAFGPAPPLLPAPPPRSGRAAGALAVAVVLAVVVAAGWWQRDRPSGAAGAADAASPPGAADLFPDRHDRRCRPLGTVAGSGRLLPAADLDGDRCPDASRWNGRILTTSLSTGGGPRAFRVGAVGDQVVLGDWDCDGVSAPAVYRPDDGRVLYADRLASAVGERVYAARIEHRPRHGVAQVVRPAPGCDEVRIAPTSKPTGAVGRRRR